MAEQKRFLDQEGVVALWSCVEDEISNVESSINANAGSIAAIKSDILNKASEINALNEAVNVLNADSSTEGSVAYQIAEIVAGADEKFDTLKEVADWIANDTTGTMSLIQDMNELKNLIGEESVPESIEKAITTLEEKAEKLYLEQKFEISNVPTGTLVDYNEKEIRVMVPSNAQFVKQSPGATGNANMYYMAFKAYAPKDAVGFKEGDRGVIVDEMFDFNGDFAGVDSLGRKYSICWLALASYSEANDTWTYYGKNSTTSKYIGWDYVVEWYDANGVVIRSDAVRISLSNENCHKSLVDYNVTKAIQEATPIAMTAEDISAAIAAAKGI